MSTTIKHDTLAINPRRLPKSRSGCQQCKVRKVGGVYSRYYCSQPLQAAILNRQVAEMRRNATSVQELFETRQYLSGVQQDSEMVDEA